jgi:hypothetical protein
MFYFAYAGHNIPPKRIEFGKIQKNPPGPNGGGTRISITGKTPEEKAVWQTLGEGNEDCVEWVVLCAALNLLEYVRFATYIQPHQLSCLHNSDEIMKAAEKNGGAASRPAPVALRDPGAPSASSRSPGPAPPQIPPQRSQAAPPPAGFSPNGPPRPGIPPAGYAGPPQGFAPPPGPNYRGPPPSGQPFPNARSPPPVQMQPALGPGMSRRF